MNFYKSKLTYINYLRKINEIKRNYSDIVTVYKIGESVLKRGIYAIEIGNSNNVKLMVGATHAQEWLTSLLLFKYIEDVCYYIKNKSNTYGVDILKNINKQGLIIIPILNPDGVEIAVNGVKSTYHLKSKIMEYMKIDNRSWQANANGVDLNHNFNAGYEISKINEIKNGINSPRCRQYGGEKYHSEPEVICLINLCDKRNISMAFSFHSQGEEIFYEYGKNTPLISKYIAKTLSQSSFYKISKQSDLASHAGFKDWFIEKLKNPAFTIEIGKGVNPLPINQLDDIYFRLRKAMFTIISL